MDIFLMNHKKPATLIDLLSLWIVCTVWPGIITGGLFAIASHRVLLGMGIAVLTGAVSVAYLYMNRFERI